MSRCLALWLAFTASSAVADPSGISEEVPPPAAVGLIRAEPSARPSPPPPRAAAEPASAEPVVREEPPASATSARRQPRSASAGSPRKTAAEGKRAEAKAEASAPSTDEVKLSAEAEATLSQEVPGAPEPAPAPLAAPVTPDEDIAALDLEALLDTPIAAASASRREEKSSRAPASVFVVTSEDIRRFGYRSLDEVLRSVPGLFVADDSFYPTPAVRGMHQIGDLTTRVLVLVDGHPLNNSVGIGQSYIGRDIPVDVLALERVEVIKGPVGSVYGPVAYFGVINLVTRKLDTAEFFAAGDYLQDTLRGGELSARGGTTLGEAELNLYANFYRNQGRDFSFEEFARSGDRELPEGDGVLRGTGYENAESVYATLRWGDFSARGGWSRRLKGLPTAPYSTIIGDTRNRFSNRTGYAELAFSRQLVEPLQLQARLSYDDFRYGDDLAYPEPPDDAGLFFDLGTDRWTTAEARATLTPFKGHRDTIGAELQMHRTVQLSRYFNLPTAIEDPDEGFGVGPIPLDFRTLNAYANVEQTFFDQLTLQAGVTFFDHSLFGNRFTPKAAAVWQPTGDDTLKLIYAEGFRPPVMFEAYFEDGLDFIPNPALRPETTVSREVIYERRIAGVASVSASFYRNSYHQLISSETVVDPSLGEDADLEDPSSFRQQFINTGTIDALGGELGFTLRMGDTLQAFGGLAVQRALIFRRGGKAEGEIPVGFSPVSGNFAVSTRALYQPLTLSLSGGFVGARVKDLANLLPGLPVRTDPAFRLNVVARLAVPTVDGLSVVLGAYNLTDARLTTPIPGDHAPISEFAEPGRSLRLGLSYRFE